MISPIFSSLERLHFLGCSWGLEKVFGKALGAFNQVLSDTSSSAGPHCASLAHHQLSSRLGSLIQLRVYFIHPPWQPPLPSPVPPVTS